MTRSDLRVEISHFTKELLRDEHRVTGRYDARLTGPDEDPTSNAPDYDPNYTDVQGAFTATFHVYARNDLRYESDLTYEVLTDRVQPWDYGGAKNSYLNMGPTLHKAMTRNRGLRVFVANGRFDLATPYLATEYAFNHLGLDPSQRDHVTMGCYDAGHMIYTRPSNTIERKKDLTALSRWAVPTTPPVFRASCPGSMQPLAAARSHAVSWTALTLD